MLRAVRQERAGDLLLPLVFHRTSGVATCQPGRWEDQGLAKHLSGQAAGPHGGLWIGMNRLSLCPGLAGPEHQALGRGVAGGTGGMASGA